ncbi:unnamed protein product [Xyrichtys novacula]|uniref:Unnamed protein product n=1 Tax=Xyrichtys novacula TaxID=13765 RepID=A0AAV1H7A6_XYRNO|nr:unnamed protein product [Xyrichtys novacula]
MAPLTISPGCQSCADFKSKVCELEQRISTLYQIQDTEKYLDTIILGAAPASSSAELELEDTAPVASSSMEVTSTFPGASAASTVATSTASLPTTVSSHLDNPWALLGAKPKASAGASRFHLSAEMRPAANQHGATSCQPLNFTPCQPEPWTAVRDFGHPGFSSAGATTRKLGPYIRIILLKPAVEGGGVQKTLCRTFFPCQGWRYTYRARRGTPAAALTGPIRSPPRRRLCPQW